MPGRSFTTHRVFPPLLDRCPERLGRGFLRSPHRYQACQSCRGSTQVARDNICAPICQCPFGSYLWLSWATGAAHGQRRLHYYPMWVFTARLWDWLLPLSDNAFSQAEPTGSQAGRGGGVVSCGNHTNSKHCWQDLLHPSLKKQAQNHLYSSPLTPSPLALKGWLGHVSTHVFILTEVWVQGSTWSPLRWHIKSLILKHAQAPLIKAC